MAEIRLSRGSDKNGRNTHTIQELVQILQDAHTTAVVGASVTGSATCAGDIEIRRDGTFALLPIAGSEKDLATAMQTAATLLGSIEDYSITGSSASRMELDDAVDMFDSDHMKCIKGDIHKICGSRRRELTVDIGGTEVAIPIPHRATLRCLDDPTPDTLVPEGSIRQIKDRPVITTSSGLRFRLLESGLNGVKLEAGLRLRLEIFKDLESLTVVTCKTPR